MHDSRSAHTAQKPLCTPELQSKQPIAWLRGHRSSPAECLPVGSNGEINGAGFSKYYKILLVIKRLEGLLSRQDYQ